MSQISRAAKGFTIIELIIAILLISILVGSIWLVFNVGFSAYYSQWRRSGVKGEVGRAFTRLVNELHLADNLTSSQAASLTFTADTDYNGVDETITYSWSGTAGAPLRRSKSAPSPAENLTLVNSVNSLAFSYYGANNTILSFPVTLSSVHLVAVNITASDSTETFFLRTKAYLEDI
ncbi:MAG: prepilin-type N-terminal cleavage/methylation domain-containing protein [Candidatus Omnitrophica bacterium]|nr:prepilin-type N-terminal cleavage/methylation domain-containing protein [Candidatus Omnitrophota bacterium]